MLSKETMCLYRYSAGIVELKRWSGEANIHEEGGSFIEHNYFYQDPEAEVISREKTLKECIADYDEEKIFSKKTLFSGNISNVIIEIPTLNTINFSLDRLSNAIFKYLASSQGKIMSFK